MNTIAAIEADPTVRLSELWLERWVGPAQLPLASSPPTLNSSTAIGDMFLQSDWPTIAAVNLPGGGPRLPVIDAGCADKIRVSKRCIVLVRDLQRQSRRSLSGRS